MPYIFSTSSSSAKNGRITLTVSVELVNDFPNDVSLIIDAIRPDVKSLQKLYVSMCEISHILGIGNLLNRKNNKEKFKPEILHMVRFTVPKKVPLRIGAYQICRNLRHIEILMEIKNI